MLPIDTLFIVLSDSLIRLDEIESFLESVQKRSESLREAEQRRMPVSSPHAISRQTSANLTEVFQGRFGYTPDSLGFFAAKKYGEYDMQDNWFVCLGLIVHVTPR